MKKYFLYIFLLAVNIYTNICYAQWGSNLAGPESTLKEINKDSTVLFCVNPLILNDKDRSKIVSALSQISIRKDFTKQIEVRKGQILSQIIKEQYNYTEANDKLTIQILSNNIKNINEINSKNSINNLKLLDIPLVAKKPKTNASKSYSQVYDLINKQTFIAHSDTLSVSDIFFENQNVKFTEAGIWAHNFTKSDLEYFKSEISMELYSKLYGISIIEISQPMFIEFDNIENIDTSNHQTVYEKKMSDEILDKIAKIDNKNFKGYYFFDFFNEEPCGHGNKVLNVIEDKLRQYGKNSISEINIHPISLDFWRNPDMAIKFMEDYYSNENTDANYNLSRLQALSYIEKLKDMTRRRKNVCVSCTPELLLSTYFKHYYNQTPDVISTSIFMKTYNIDIMPRFRECATTLVTAATNVTNQAIEDLTIVDPAQTTGSLQPLYSYLYNYQNIGCLIVGCFQKEGKPFGMHSRNGDRISVIARGTRWQGSCINYNEIGTSYATPEVAINVYFAKAYWRSKNYFPNANETRTKVLISSDIDTNYIDKYASSGTINLQKLFFLEESLIQFNSDSITSCKIDNNSFIKYNNGFQVPFTKCADCISALTIIDNNIYAFFESKIAWKKILVNE